MKRTNEEPGKMGGVMCDRREVMLHGRSLNSKEVVIFMVYLDIASAPGSNPHQAKKFGQTGAE